jgi:hypothetical protein
VIPLIVLDTIDCCSSRDGTAAAEVPTFSAQESAEPNAQAGRDESRPPHSEAPGVRVN